MSDEGLFNDGVTPYDLGYIGYASPLVRYWWIVAYHARVREGERVRDYQINQIYETIYKSLVVQHRAIIVSSTVSASTRKSWPVGRQGRFSARLF